MKTQHTKISPHVTKFCLQSHIIIRTKIHPHTFIHKNPPEKPAICLSLLFLHMSIISTHKHFVTPFIKNPHISENMTIWPRNSNEQTGWGHTGEPATVSRNIFSSTINMHHCTLILQCPTKRLKNSHASLFDLITSKFFADIFIWLSGLKHCYKFKHVISCFKYMSNPVIFATPTRVMESVSLFRSLLLVQPSQVRLGTQTSSGQVRW